MNHSRILELQLMVALELWVTYTPPGIFGAGARPMLEWFIDSNFHAWHILGICQSVKNACIKPTRNCPPGNQGIHMGRLSKHASQGWTQRTQSLTWYLQRKNWPSWWTLLSALRANLLQSEMQLHSLEAEYFVRTSDTKQGPSRSPQRSSTISFPITAREKEYVNNDKSLTTQGISEKRQSWIIKILNKLFGES